MLDFNSCLADVQVDDLNCKRLPLTQSNKRGDGVSTLSIIDRMLCNDIEGDVFPNSEVVIMDAGISDHCPILLTVNKHRRNCRKHFKMFDFWMRHPEFQQIPEESWNKHYHTTNMCKMYAKLKRLKPQLKVLKNKYNSGIFMRVIQAKAAFNSVQQSIQLDGATGDKKQLEWECKLKYIAFCKDEEASYTKNQNSLD